MICSSCGAYISTPNCRLCGIKDKGKKVYKIPPIGDKRKEDLKLYKVLRIGFLKKHPMCAVFPGKKATEVHHKSGRGKHLNNVSTWLAVSREGHQAIEMNPNWAKENNFSQTRL